MREQKVSLSLIRLATPDPAYPGQMVYALTQKPGVHPVRNRHCFNDCGPDQLIYGTLNIVPLGDWHAPR